MMIRRLLLCACVSFAAVGQIGNLVTTDDGSRLYFSSPWRQRGTNQFLHFKIFSLDAQGIRLAVQRPYEQFQAFDRFWTNFYQMIEPDVSGDGSVIVYTGLRNCSPSRSCLSLDETESVILGATRWFAWRVPGRVRLSRNGRYAMAYGANSLEDSGVFLIDLVSGNRTRLSVGFPNVAEVGRRAVASDGTVVFVEGPAGLVVVGPRGSRVLETPEWPSAAVIDDLATTVVFQHVVGRTGARRLWLMDLASGNVWRLAPEVPAPSQPWLSNDGRFVLFLSQGQIFIINRDGSGLRELVKEAAGFHEATVSGDGRVAYLVTRDFRLLRVNVPTGETQDLVGQTPLVTGLGRGAQGSLVRLLGAGLAASSLTVQPPLPTFLGGVRVTVGGMLAPLVAVSPGEIRFQVPWEVQGDTPAAIVEVTSNSPLDAGELKAYLYPGSGFLPVRVGDADTVAVHGRSGAPVTFQNPARPGEVIRVFMTGLGPVQPPVLTGVASPPAPLAAATTPVGCEFLQLGQAVRAEVWAAELAPGLVGVYQVVVRVPPGLSGIPEVACGLGGQAWDVTTMPLGRPDPPRARR